MKKLLIIIINILFLFSLSTSVKSYDELGSAPITVEVLPSYIIDIPPSLHIDYKKDDSYIGAIYAENMLIDAGYELQIDIDHTPFINKSNPNIVMPYTCNCYHGCLTCDEDSIPLEIHVEDHIWDIYPSGAYESQMTFTINYVKV